MAKTLTRLSPIATWQAVLQRLYPMLLLLAIGLLAWMIASSIWLAIVPPTAPSVQPIALTPPQPKSINPNLLDIFAKPTAQTVNQPPPDIKVVGVTVATPEIASYAILNSGGKTLSYNIGSLIGTSQYKLTKVTQDFIVVTAPDGTTQQIDFGKKFSLDQSDAIYAKLQNQVQNPSGNNLNNISNPSNATNNNGMNNPIAHNNTTATTTPTSNINPVNNPATSPTVSNNTPQAALANAATALQQNPAGYLSSMGLSATGQGYQVTDATPANIKNRIGLQTGDRVLSVNGQNVGQNPAQDAQVLQQVQQSGQAQIQVQRGEQVITIRQSL